MKLSCADPDCDTPQVLGKFVCIKHGAYGYCTTDACITNAMSMSGKCKKHDSKTVACSTEGCSNLAKGKGLCDTHGGRGFCSFNKCTTAVAARGRCFKHGGGSRKVCKGLKHMVSAPSMAHMEVVVQPATEHGFFPPPCLKQCVDPDFERSICKHGGGIKPCSVAGCTTNSRRKGLFANHGGGKGECVFGGCTNRRKHVEDMHNAPSWDEDLFCDQGGPCCCCCCCCESGSRCPMTVFRCSERLETRTAASGTARTTARTRGGGVG